MKTKQSCMKNIEIGGIKKKYPYRLEIDAETIEEAFSITILDFLMEKPEVFTLMLSIFRGMVEKKHIIINDATGEIEISDEAEVLITAMCEVKSKRSGEVEKAYR